MRCGVERPVVGRARLCDLPRALEPQQLYTLIKARAKLLGTCAAALQHLRHDESILKRDGTARLGVMYMAILWAVPSGVYGHTMGGT